MTPDQYRQLKAFARQDGALMGLMWVLSFACFAMSQRQPLLSIAFDLSIVMIPVLASVFARRYRDNVLDGIISFRRAFGYVLLLFLYATLILAIAQWAYFQYIDGGALVGGMLKTVNSDEFKAVLEAYKLSKADVNAQLQALAEARPIDFAFTFIWMNMTAGIIIAWITALFTKRSKQTAR